MLRLRKAFTTAVESRNLAGLQLIDRQDELGLLQEKQKIYRAILQRGEEALTQRVDEMRVVRLQIAELQRRYEVAARQTPSPATLEVSYCTSSLLLTVEYLRFLETLSASSPSNWTKNALKRFVVSVDCAPSHSLTCDCLQLDLAAKLEAPQADE